MKLYFLLFLVVPSNMVAAELPSADVFFPWLSVRPVQLTVAKKTSWRSTVETYVESPVEQSHASVSLADDVAFVHTSTLLGANRAIAEWRFAEGETIYTQAIVKGEGSQAPINPSDELHVTIESRSIGGVEYEQELETVLSNSGASEFLCGTIDGASIETYLMPKDRPKFAAAEEDAQERWSWNSSLGSVQLSCKTGTNEVRALSVKKSGGNISQGRRVDEIQMNGGGPWPPGKVGSITVSITDIEYALHGSIRYPTRFVFRREVQCATGDIVTEEVDYDCTSFDSPDQIPVSELRTKLEIPVGWQCTAIGAEFLPFHWDGQTVVPTVVSLESQTEALKSGSLGRPQVLMVINVLVFAAVGAAFLFKRIYNQRG